MPSTFHLLTESEPFSEHLGGAVSRWVANVVGPDPSAIVLAPSADDSWHFSPERIRVVPRLLPYKRLNDLAGGFLRWPFRKIILRNVLQSALTDLRSGDTLWVHNRPEFAAAIAPLIHARGARLVLHLHNSHLIEWPARWMRAIHADCYAFLTHFIQAEALQHVHDLGRTAVTYSGADRRIFFPNSIASERPKPLVLFVGRLVPEKGVHVLIEAMRLLQQREISLQCLILGGTGFGHTAATPYVEQLHRDAPSNVRFEPYCSGMALGDRFREADIFCAPSIWQEALGLVVVEAMASGLPVVTTRSGGIPEMLAHGGGLLVARNSATELADALGQLATDADLRQRLAQQALASFHQSFTWDVVRANYHRIVDSVQSAERIPGCIATPSPRQEEPCPAHPTSA